MEPLSIAAAGASAIGSILGGIGASKRAKAIKRAIRANTRDTRAFTKEQLEGSDKLANTKQDYLESGDPLEDMGRFIFGGEKSGVLGNIRKAQSDFAKLGAGDTSGFTREVSSIVQNALSNTFGGPKGSFENLSVKNLFNLRQGGLQSALSTTDFLNRTGSQLTNAKFGILDQTFERQLALKQNQLNVVNSNRLQRAQNSAVGWMAAGNHFNNVAGALSGLGAQQQNQEAISSNNMFNASIMDLQYKKMGANTPNFISQMLGGANTGQSPFNNGSQSPQPAYQNSSGMTASPQISQNTFGGLTSPMNQSNPFSIGVRPSVLNNFNTPAIDLYTNDTSLLPPVGVLPTY